MQGNEHTCDLSGSGLWTLSVADVHGCVLSLDQVLYQTLLDIRAGTLYILADPQQEGVYVPMENLKSFLRRSHRVRFLAE